MEKVLLAINGIKPSQKVFQYAVHLCQRLKAELSVLQVIRPGQYGEYIKRFRRGANRARGLLEGSMVAAAFAEAGEHGTAMDIMAQARKNINRLLPETEKAGISYHLTMKSGPPGKEIIHYVNEHRDVVLAIYDGAREGNPERDARGKKRELPMEIRQHLSVPVVVVHG